MEIVRIKNTQSTPLALPHDNHGHIVLDPGQEKILHLDYVNVYFGNPAARNEGKMKTREETYNRVRVYWGFYAGMEPESVWEAQRPQFEVHTLEGERVWTVLEDPLGLKDVPNLDSDLSEDPRFVNAKIADLIGQVERLTAIVAQQSGTPAVDADALVERQVAQHLEQLQDQHVPTIGDIAELDTGAIPPPPDHEPPVTPDRPRTTRTGPRR